MWVIMLTHLPLDKMAAILTDDSFADTFLLIKEFCFLSKNSLKFVPKGLNDNNPALA